MSHLFNTIEAVAIFLIVLSYVPKYEAPPVETSCHTYGCVCFKNKAQF